MFGEVIMGDAHTISAESESQQVSWKRTDGRGRLPERVKSEAENQKCAKAGVDTTESWGG